MNVLYVVRDHEKCVATTGWRLKAISESKRAAKYCKVASVTQLRKDGDGNTYRSVERVYPDGRTETIQEEERI